MDHLYFRYKKFINTVFFLLIGIYLIFLIADPDNSRFLNREKCVLNNQIETHFYFNINEILIEDVFGFSSKSYPNPKKIKLHLVPDPADYNKTKIIITIIE